MSLEYPPKCPNCGRRDVEIRTEREYTGGGYADTYDIFECRACGNEWSGEETTDYM